MLFNSFEFIFLFFPLVTVIYYLLGFRMKIFWLLLASCFFYMFFVPEYIAILFLAIVIDYGAGIFIERAVTQRRKKTWLVVSVVSTCLLLFVFKYYNFFIGNFNALASLTGSSVQLSYWSVLLPIGLSFHTFQSLSYVIEVYRGNVKAEKDFAIYSLYVLFYPQLVAGPIERPQNIIPQIHQEKKFSWNNIFYGLRLMTWGMFKKVVIADNVAVYADNVFNNWQNQHGLTVYLGAFFFTIQIYCDFSGYSDIARGTAKTLGYDLMENFNLPYLATSIKDFWARWHISLSTWFRDYLYFPLGGNRISKKRTIINQFFVFMISGLWHGANWNFICWGGLHGLFVGIQNAFFPKQAEPKTALVLRWVKRALIFNLVLLCWIYFRAPGFSQANGMIKNMLVHLPDIGSTLLYIKDNGGLRIILWLCICLLFLGLDRQVTTLVRSSFASYRFKYALLMSFLISCICLIGFWGKINFIYFQF